MAYSKEVLLASQSPTEALAYGITRICLLLEPTIPNPAIYLGSSPSSPRTKRHILRDETTAAIYAACDSYLCHKLLRANVDRVILRANDGVMTIEAYGSMEDAAKQFTNLSLWRRHV